MAQLPRRTLLSAGLALPALALTPRVGAATTLDLPPGTPVYLRDTSHIYLVGTDRQLHWLGDTRALEGKSVRWDQRQIWSYSQLVRTPLGDPYLSAGLLKHGDPIYLVKWEHDWEYPKLLHIPSIRDVEIFGINGSNYGRFVMDAASWETRYGFTVSNLEHGGIQPATWGQWRGHVRGLRRAKPGETGPGAAYDPAKPDWIAIQLFRSWPVIGFAMQRGTDRLFAFIPWSHSDLSEDPGAGHPHIAYSMHGPAALSAPQLWRGQDGGSHAYPFLHAHHTDTTERPYARQLLDTIRRGVAVGSYDLTVTWEQNGQTWRWVLDVSGIETALAWLYAEQARPTPPRSRYFEPPGNWCPSQRGSSYSNLPPEDQARCLAQ